MPDAEDPALAMKAQMPDPPRGAAPGPGQRIQFRAGCDDGKAGGLRTRVDVGVQGDRVVITVTVSDAVDPGAAQAARLRLTPDEAMYLCNWVGEGLLSGAAGPAEAAG
jgi:hypothetical protein